MATGSICALAGWLIVINARAVKQRDAGRRAAVRSHWFLSGQHSRFSLITLKILFACIHLAGWRTLTANGGDRGVPIRTIAGNSNVINSVSTFL